MCIYIYIYNFNFHFLYINVLAFLYFEHLQTCTVWMNSFS